MRIAIPVVDGVVARHFGHCQQFALLDVETDSKRIVTKEFVDAPDHQPGLLPGWLAERGANVIIAGGMGVRAQQLFAQQGIEVLAGSAVQDPEAAVEAYLAGTLETSENPCDH